MNEGRSLALRAIAWVVACAAAWGIGSVLLDSPSITEPAQVWSYAFTMSLYSALVAAPIAFVGSFVLRPFLRRPWAWALATMVGLPTGFLVGFLVNALTLYRQVHAMGMALTGEGGGASMAPVAAITLAVAGVVLALAQSPALASGLVAAPRPLVLWLLATGAALGIGWFLSAGLVDEIGSALPGRGLLMGTISGAIVFGVLLVMDAQKRRPTTRWSRPA